MSWGRWRAEKRHRPRGEIHAIEVARKRSRVPPSCSFHPHRLFRLRSAPRSRSPTLPTALIGSYDGSNAVTASQMVAVQAPLLTGEAGDWRLAVSPATCGSRLSRSSSRGSLDFDYNRLVGEKWGFYVVALSELRPHGGDVGFRVAARAASSGPTSPRALTTPSFNGTYPAGGNILTMIQSAGFLYDVSWRTRGERFPVALFGGPVLTQSFARDLRFDYAFAGTYVGGAKTIPGRGDLREPPQCVLLRGRARGGYGGHGGEVQGRASRLLGRSRHAVGAERWTGERGSTAAALCVRRIPTVPGIPGRWGRSTS